jgi:hypothetical protein
MRRLEVWLADFCSWESANHFPRCRLCELRSELHEAAGKEHFSRISGFHIGCWGANSRHISRSLRGMCDNFATLAGNLQSNRARNGK